MSKCGLLGMNFFVVEWFVYEGNFVSWFDLSYVYKSHKFAFILNY
jgi:hypothetical protein